MPTLKAVQRLHRIKKDGTAEIQIRITHDRKVVYVHTGYFVKPAQLKDGIVTKHLNADLLNINIEQKKAELLKKILHQDLLDEEINIRKATGKKPDSTETMFGGIRHVMKMFEAQKKVASYNRMVTNLEYIEAVWGKDKYITDVKKTDVEAYVNHRYKLGNAASTVKKNLADLASVLNHIGYQGYNHFTAYAKTIKAKPVKRNKLTEDNIKALEDIYLTGLADLARDMYLFSFYTHGMRFENVATFKREDIIGDHLSYRMNKGEDLREIFIHSKLRAIINKYIYDQTLYLFPVVTKMHDDWTKKDIIGAANTLINKYLIKAAFKAGIEVELSFHTARHTFAYLSKRKNVNANVIQDALGHQKASTTQGYLKSLDDDYINDALKGLYE